MTDERRREIISAAKLQWESATFEECCDWAIRTALAEDRENWDRLRGLPDISRQIRAEVWREAAYLVHCTPADSRDDIIDLEREMLDKAEAMERGDDKTTTAG